MKYKQNNNYNSNSIDDRGGVPRADLDIIKYTIARIQERVIFFIRHFSSWSTLHCNALAAWAACLDPRLSSPKNLFPQNSFPAKISSRKNFPAQFSIDMGTPNLQRILFAHRPVGDDAVIQSVALQIDTLVKLSTKDLHSQYAEDEPENETHQ